VAGLPDLLVPLAQAPERSALCLDFDGTLSAIVDDPRAARPLPGVPDLLARLARRLGLVAVISGRPVSFLQSALQPALGPPAGVRLVGLYGLEQIAPDGRRTTAADAAPWEAVITEVVDRARAEAAPGVYVEPKGLTVTLHWRNAPGEAEWVAGFAARQAEERGLQVHRGRRELELRPPLAVDKGTVVRDLTVGYEAVAAFGDDIGDLPAFAALAELGSAGVAVARVAVVDQESPAVVAEQADLTVDGPAGALALLEQLAGAVGAVGA
jgi:trehalose 6-phosphate phosphatase